MTTLIDARTAEKSQAELTIVKARQEMMAIDKALEAAKRDASTEAAKAAELQRAYSVIRQKLAKEEMPAAAGSLVGDLEENLKLQRTTNAAVAATADKVSWLEREKARVGSLLDVASAAAASAAAALKDAEKHAAAFAGWKALLEAPSTAQAVQDAKDVATSDGYKAAMARFARLGLDDMLPVFRARADAATKAAAEPVQRALDAAKAAAQARKTNEVLASARMDAGVTFAAKVADVQAIAEGTVDKVAAAKDKIAAVARPVTADPPADVVARMTQRKAKAKTAAAEEAKVFAEQVKVIDARKAFDAAAVAAVGADPDVDLVKSDVVKAEREALAAAEKALGAAITAADAKKGDLDVWEVAIPPDLLSDIIDFVTAEETLKAIAKLTPADLDDDLGKAEEDYVKALVAEQKYQRSLARLAAELEARQRDEQAAAGVAAARRQLLIRGDR